MANFPLYVCLMLLPIASLALEDCRSEQVDYHETPDFEARGPLSDKSMRRGSATACVNECKQLSNCKAASFNRGLCRLFYKTHDIRTEERLGATYFEMFCNEDRTRSTNRGGIPIKPQKPSGCKDALVGCQILLDECHSSRFEELLNNYCAQTCGFCVPSPAELLDPVETRTTYRKNIITAPRNPRYCQPHVTKYIQTDDYKPTGNSVLGSPPAAFSEDCMRACSRTKNCALASFHREERDCQMVGFRGSLSVSRREGWSSFQKLCVDSRDVADRCPAAFRHTRKHVLVGFTDAIRTADNLRTCVYGCLRAEQDLGFRCKSVMFYGASDTDNCFFNTESAENAPDFFVATTMEVDYVEVDCN